LFGINIRPGIGTFILDEVDDYRATAREVSVMRFGAILLAVVTMFLATPSFALDQRDIKNCDQSVDWDRKIAGCTIC